MGNIGTLTNPWNIYNSAEVQSLLSKQEKTRPSRAEEKRHSSRSWAVKTRHPPGLHQKHNDLGEWLDGPREGGVPTWRFISDIRFDICDFGVRQMICIYDLSRGSESSACVDWANRAVQLSEIKKVHAQKNPPTAM